MYTDEIEVEINFVRETIYLLLDFTKVQSLFTNEVCCSSVASFNNYLYIKYKLFICKRML